MFCGRDTRENIARARTAASVCARSVRQALLFITFRQGSSELRAPPQRIRAVWEGGPTRVSSPSPSHPRDGPPPSSRLARPFSHHLRLVVRSDAASPVHRHPPARGSTRETARHDGSARRRALGG